MKKTVKTGAPLNPPIWWIDPTNPVAYNISSGELWLWFLSVIINVIHIFTHFIQTVNASLMALPEIIFGN